jgi:hypothetical protein
MEELYLLTLVILAIQEAEIKRFKVIPRQIVHETLSQKRAGGVGSSSKSACLASMRP